MSIRYSHQEARYDYFAPLIGNGRIATHIGPDGTNGCTAASPAEERQRTDCPTANIWWEGRRYIDVFTRDLVPFGHTEQTVQVGGRAVPFPTAWEQELHPEDALLVCRNEYTDALHIVTRVFIHHDMDMLVIEKAFSGDPAEYVFCYRLSEGPQSAAPPRGMHIRESLAENAALFSYTLHGQEEYSGEIAVLADVPGGVSAGSVSAELTCEGNEMRCHCRVHDGDVLRFYILLSDGAAGSDGLPDMAAMLSAVKMHGFDRLLASHREKWNAFFKEGYAKTGDARIDAVYTVALYMLKCYTGPWSIPVGINDSHWGGRYFAFDEYFSFLGLLEGNHRLLAARVPEFRFKGLPRAITRASSRGQQEARFPWETVETGEEASPPGFWYDHIFHMAHIAIGAWEYYAYSGDTDWLKAKGYPLLYACSQFYIRHAIYRVGGRTFVGKCSDLERLGSSVENAFMTTCSVIRTLHVTAAAARLIGEEAEYAATCDELAQALLAGLPEENGAFVPHPGCGQKSIAVFAGVFPYRVIDENDPRQEKAIGEYLEQESLYGNMYAVGHAVSTWYACWKAMLFARLQRKHDALDAVRQAAQSTGCFAECFEINEKDCLYRPWFSTAGGIFVSSVNEMLLQSDGETLRILPAAPAEIASVCFRLAAESGRVVSVKTQQNRLVSLRIEGGKVGSVRLLFPAHVDTSLLGENKPEHTVAHDGEVTCFR